VGPQRNSVPTFWDSRPHLRRGVPARKIPYPRHEGGWPDAVASGKVRCRFPIRRSTLGGMSSIRLPQIRRNQSGASSFSSAFELIFPDIDARPSTWLTRLIGRRLRRLDQRP
jgi:hypothetical protein